MNPRPSRVEKTVLGMVVAFCYPADHAPEALRKTPEAQEESFAKQIVRLVQRERAQALKEVADFVKEHCYCDCGNGGSCAVKRRILSLLPRKSLPPKRRGDVKDTEGRKR